MSVVFYGCVSMDGYLATKDHSLDWLYNSGTPEDTDYESFYRTIDISIMGRNTFDEVIKMGTFHEMYPTTINYVFTSHDDLEVQGATFVSGDVASFVKGLDPSKNVWIVGGGGLVTTLLEQNLIDAMILQIAPVVLGSGIPLIMNTSEMKMFELTGVHKYGPFAQLEYKRK